MRLAFVSIAMFASVMSTPLAAQWLKLQTPGIPRTPDGKPNLSAPAPRAADGKPDLSGLWRMNGTAYMGNVTADLKPGEVQPWAAALYKQRMEDLGKDDPSTYQCLPSGPRYSYGAPMVRIMQTPGLIAFLYEDLVYRQVFMDGRTLPADPNPSWMGYSVGHWDGDTLVVESIGFNDRSWLDFGGHPHSESLRVTERYRRRDFGHMELHTTMEDPKAYEKPWTMAIDIDFVPDTEMIEYVCNENEKDHQHLVGKASDETKNAVHVAPEVLAKYTGTYEFRVPEDPTFVMLFNVTLSDGVLFIDIGGKGKLPLTPLSPTLFTLMGGRMEFVTDDRGVVTHLAAQAVEGNMKAVRKPDSK
jgi:hypothetical protein